MHDGANLSVHVSGETVEGFWSVQGERGYALRDFKLNIVEVHVDNFRQFVARGYKLKQ